MNRKWISAGEHRQAHRGLETPDGCTGQKRDDRGTGPFRASGAKSMNYCTPSLEK